MIGREAVGSAGTVASSADAHGRIAELIVMIRPASGLMAVAERMGPALESAGV